MKRIIDTSEILGTVVLPNGAHEVCAEADANYDEGTNRLVVRLSSFLRAQDPQAQEKRLSANWLPQPETVTESIGLDEAGEVTRDIFHRWVRKVRQTAPSLYQPSF